MSERSVVFRTPPDGVDVVHAALESLWETQVDVEEMDRMMFETALIELVANVIQHGTSSAAATVCELDLTADEASLHAVLTDSTDVPLVDLTPREMPDEFAESGRGIAFIQALVDEFDLQPAAGRNVWTLHKQRSRQNL